MLSNPFASPCIVDGQGTALFFALKIDTMARQPLAGWLLQWEGLYKALTHMTIFMELYAPLIMVVSAVHPLVKLLTVLAFMGLHVGMGLALHIGMFPIVCVIAWIAFLPGRLWDAVHWPAPQCRLTPPQCWQSDVKFVFVVLAVIVVLAANGRNIRATQGDSPEDPAGEGALVTALNGVDGYLKVLAAGALGLGGGHLYWGTFASRHNRRSMT